MGGGVVVRLGRWVIRVFAPVFVFCQLAVAVNDNRTIARWHTDRRWLTTGTAAALPP